MLPIVGRQADVWHCFAPPGRLQRKWDIVRRNAEDSGRDPDGIRRASSLSLSRSWDDVRRDAEGLARWGVSYLVVSWPSEGRRHLDDFIENVMPDLGGL